MQTVLITGANKGLGFETAKYLLQNDFVVFLGCRDVELGKKAVEELKSQGLNSCESILIDVTDPETINRALKELESKINHLDVLINNAGMLGRIPTPDNPLTITDIQRVFDTNFFGTIRVTEAFLPLLKQAEHPRIANVTSDMASLTLHQDPTWKYFPFKGTAYGPSKTALNAYTIAMAHQLKGQGFKINCVTPGHTATDFNNHRGERKPEDTCQTIAKYAMIDQNGPTGKFFEEDGELPW